MDAVVRFWVGALMVSFEQNVHGQHCLLHGVPSGQPDFLSIKKFGY